MLWISMQQRLFSNSISIGLRGIFVSNGFTYATPLPVIVCLGVNEVLFGHNVNDTTSVFPGSTHILFLATVVSKFVGCIICLMHNLAMLTIVQWMFILKLSHRGILSHTLMLLAELSGGPILMVFLAKSEI